METPKRFAAPSSSGERMAKDRMRGRPIAKTRVTLYQFEGDFPESPLKKVLDAAKARGVITQYDTGRGHLVWFEGPASEAMRELRDEVKALVAKGYDGWKPRRLVY